MLSAKKKYFSILMVCFLIILSISCVSAVELNDGNNSILKVGPTDNNINHLVKDCDFTINDNANVIKDNSNAKTYEINGVNYNTNSNNLNSNTINDNSTNSQSIKASFDELNDEFSNISDGSVFNITKDYENTKNGNYNFVLNANNITINGNGHIIDGKKQSSMFEIRGENIMISNLKFINFENSRKITGKGLEYETGGSLIKWIGNEGSISDCIFMNNTGFMGTGMNWRGDNGTIENIVFANNFASGFGGAIYVYGKNNNLNNITLANSISLISGDGIYIDGESHPCHLTDIKSDTQNPVFDGSYSIIETDKLSKVYKSPCKIYMSDKEMDVAPLIYMSLVTGGAMQMDKEIFFYSQYNSYNKVFLFEFSREFSSGFLFRKTMTFKNIENLNDLFSALYSSNFENRLSYLKRAYVHNQNDYENALTITRASIDNDPNFKKTAKDFWFNPAESIVIGLDIQFDSNLTINSKSTWHSEGKGFDVIYIEGKNSTVKTSSTDRSENKWFIHSPNITLLISNLNVESFNMALHNLGGTCILENMVFKNNRMNYISDKDDGAGIYNEKGLCICYNCQFNDNFARNGAAIYNEKGQVICQSCTFSGNTAYKEGAGIYNEKGTVDCIASLFRYEHAEKNGGDIFNHYGKMNLFNDTFQSSKADGKGGVIYNDFGQIEMDQCNIENPYASEAPEIFNYGEEAISNVTNSYLISSNGKEAIGIISDEPSEVARWALRAGVVIGGVALCVVCSVLQMHGLTAGIVCFIGGAILAGAEEAIEECCLDHDFHIGNVLAMAGVAGIFSAIAGGASAIIADKVFQLGSVELTKIIIAKITVVDALIDLVADTITEVIPRLDFIDHKVGDMNSDGIDWENKYRKDILPVNDTDENQPSPIETTNNIVDMNGANDSGNPISFNPFNPFSFDPFSFDPFGLIDNTKYNVGILS